MINLPCLSSSEENRKTRVPSTVKKGDCNWNDFRLKGCVEKNSKWYIFIETDGDTLISPGEPTTDRFLFSSYDYDYTPGYHPPSRLYLSE